jgi:hypothetical protein
MGIDRVGRRGAPRSHVAELQLNPGRGVRYGLAAPRGAAGPSIVNRREVLSGLAPSQLRRPHSSSFPIAITYAGGICAEIHAIDRVFGHLIDSYPSILTRRLTDATHSELASILELIGQDPRAWARGELHSP